MLLLLILSDHLSKHLNFPRLIITVGASGKRPSLVSDRNHFNLSWPQCLPCINQVVCSCKKLLQKVESSYNFWDKICTSCSFYWPKANLFCSRWRNSSIWYDSFIILSNQKSVFTQLATSWFVARQFWTRGVKRATSLFNSFCSKIAKYFAHFCYPNNRSFIETQYPDFIQVLRPRHLRTSPVATLKSLH